MDLRVLRYFLTVAKEQSFTKAAEQLHIPQPTLSRPLAALEEELETPLFKRGGHHITLTDEGMEIKGNTTKLLYTLQSRRSLFKGKMIFGVMEIFLTVFMEMGVVLLLGKIHGYTEAFPAGQFFYASWRRVQKQEV